MTRSGTAERTTAETAIRVRIDLDGTGKWRSRPRSVSWITCSRSSRVTRWSTSRCAPAATSQVDEHHTVEDTALVLGRAIDEALGERAGIRRYGDVRLPMDEALALCAVDLGGRAFSDVEPRPDPLAGGNVWLELWPHFVETLAREMRASVHLEVRKARSTHHLVEGGVKSLARALRQAWEPDPQAGRCRRRGAEQQGHAAVIAVVDFGSGNTRSVLRALEAVGADARLVGTAEGIDAAERVVLPGVGAAPSAVDALMARGLWEPVRRWGTEQRPLLGLCLGAQLLLDGSDEGDAPGLGWLIGPLSRIPVRWRMEARARSRTPAGTRSAPPPAPSTPTSCMATGSTPTSPRLPAGPMSTDSASRRCFAPGPLTGTQFHPEKSGPTGRALLAAFAAGALDARAKAAHMELICAIDLLDGGAVRLVQGDYERRIAADAGPASLARRFVAAGCRRLHVVDLAGASAGRPMQLPLLGEIVAAARAEAPGVVVEAGGGLRSPGGRRRAARARRRGAAGDRGHRGCRPSCVVAPSRTPAGSPCRSTCATGGRRSTAGCAPAKRMPRALAQRLLADGASRLIVTDTGRDGTLAGPNLELMARLRAAIPDAFLVAAGGIGSIDDLRALEADRLRRCRRRPRAPHRRDRPGGGDGGAVVTLRKRIIACLDVTGGRVVKGTPLRRPRRCRGSRRARRALRGRGSRRDHDPGHRRHGRRPSRAAGR